jgi:hypothetical protein
LQGDQWNKLERFITTYAPHDVRAVISQGKILLAVWREDPGAESRHGVWYSYTTLETPELPSVPWPTQVAISKSTPLSFATQLAPTSTPINLSVDINQEDTLPIVSTDPAAPFIISIVPVLIILIVIIFFSYFSRIRRR